MSRAEAGEQSWIDGQADSFEAAWKSETPPRIEDYLRELPGPSRARLLEELLRVELDVRRDRGETPTPEEYGERIPEHIEMTQALFREGSARRRPVSDAPASTDSSPAPTDMAEDETSADLRIRQADLRIRCPQCSGSIDLTHRTTAEQALCPSCGSSFRLDPESAEAWVYRRGDRFIGRFELLEMVGAGNFGTVYKALDPRLDRLVALKVLRPCDSKQGEQRDRFIREARSSAQLRHIAIVPVFEVGEHEGRPFIVSEFIQGVTLSHWLNLRKPSFQESAHLVAEIADALQYAHDRGIVHRDVKPSNVLLDEHDHPHMMDFGLAKRDVGEITMTLDGQVLGTPAYMSPEQARGEGHSVDGRSDVYSLGVIIYELLTSGLPFRGTTRMLLHQVLHDEPRSPRGLNDRIPRAMETICLKAMAKEPTRRYGTARELAEDLRRFLKGELIAARPTGWLTKRVLWAKRNPRVAWLSAAVYALLVVVTAGAVVAVFNVNAARHDARSNLVRVNLLNGVRLVQEGSVSSSLPWLVESLKRDDADHGREAIHRIRIGSVLRGSPRPVHFWSLPGSIETATFSADGSRVLIAGGGEARIFNAATGEQVTAFHGSSAPAPAGAVWHRTAGFSKDGKRVVTALGPEVRVWDAESGEPVSPFLHHDDPVTCVAFSDDGRLVATSSNGRVLVWLVETGRKVSSDLEHPDLVRHLVFTADGRLLVSYGGPAKSVGGAWLWTPPFSDPPHFVRLDHDDDVLNGAFSSDGSRVITASYDKSARIWESATGECLAFLWHSTHVAQATFSPDGAHVMTVAGHEARVWDAHSGTIESPPLRHRADIRFAAFSPDGRRIVTCGFDRVARVWDAGSGSEIIPPLPHNGDVNQAAFSPDGRYLVTASADETARMWDLASGVWPDKTLPHAEYLRHAAFSPDGRRVVSVSREGMCKVWDVTADRAQAAVIYHGGDADHADFDSDGSHIVTIGPNRTAQVWQTDSPARAMRSLKHPGPAHAAAFNPDEKRFVAVFSPAGQRLLTLSGFAACVWDLRNGKLLHSFRHDEGDSLTHAAFSPDGSIVVTTARDGTIRVRRVDDGKEVTGPLRHDGEVVSVAFSRDGSRFVTASLGRTARVWDVGKGACIATLSHMDGVNHASFSPDGSLVVTASSDHTAGIWDLLTGTLKVPFLYHEGPVLHACFSDDGNLVATGSGGEREGDVGWARVWDPATGDAVTLPMRHGCGVRHVAFPKRATHLLTVSYRDTTAKIWSLPPVEHTVADLERIAQVFAGVAIDRTGGQTPLSSAELGRAHRDLANRFPGTFSTSPADVLAWREAEARSFANAGYSSDAVARFDLLIEQDPRNKYLLALRADSHAGLRNWKEAVRDFARAIEYGSESLSVWYGAALVYLQAQDLDRYHSLCEGLMLRFGDVKDERRSNGLAYLCTLGPEAVANFDRVVELARLNVQAKPDESSYRNTLGAALYRAGRFSDAIDQFNAGMKAHGEGGTPVDWLFLSMACHSLNRDADALDWLRKADEAERAVTARPKHKYVPNWQRYLEIGILRKEVESLIPLSYRLTSPRHPDLRSHLSTPPI
jgi:WD40 repeat protein/tetratricopeptide (TPR) repeat protein